jgi:Na+/H+-dicarboxylate symporter
MSSAAGRRVPLLVQILLGLVLGSLLGTLFGARVAWLGDLGTLVVRLLKALATPLVFFAITDSLMRGELPGGKGLRLLALCLVNAAVAGTVAVSLALLVQPGRGASFGPAPPSSATAQTGGHGAPHVDLSTGLAELVPESLAGPFVQNQVLTVVLMAIATGAALRRLRLRGTGERLAELLGLVLGWVVQLVPLAVFGVVARAVGTIGFGVFSSLGKLIVTVGSGLLLHVALWYSLILVFVARRNPLAFFRRATEPLLTALSTGSSMATVPVTLRTLEGPLGVSPMSARLAALIGTNFNNDGIMLYEVAAALFIAQAHGLSLGPGQLALLCGTSALAAAGIAGVPEAGLITLSLVLTSAGLPLTELPLLLTVDWMLGRLRATTNVASDLTIAAALDGGAPLPSATPAVDGSSAPR